MQLLEPEFQVYHSALLSFAQQPWHQADEQLFEKASLPFTKQGAASIVHGGCLLLSRCVNPTLAHPLHLTYLTHPPICLNHPTPSPFLFPPEFLLLLLRSDLLSARTMRDFDLMVVPHIFGYATLGMHCRRLLCRATCPPLSTRAILRVRARVCMLLSLSLSHTHTLSLCSVFIAWFTPLPLTCMLLCVCVCLSLSLCACLPLSVSLCLFASVSLCLPLSQMFACRRVC